MRRRATRWIDVGTDSEAPVDYPTFCAACGPGRGQGGRADLGIVIGGSGQGEQIAANKVHGARAALCHDEFTARLSRRHNDANVLALGARVLGPRAGPGDPRHLAGARASRAAVTWPAWPADRRDRGGGVRPLGRARGRRAAPGPSASGRAVAHGLGIVDEPRRAGWCGPSSTAPRAGASAWPWAIRATAPSTPTARSTCCAAICCPCPGRAGPTDRRRRGRRSAAVKGHPMAKAALELAVLDAEGRAAGQSLAPRLGGDPPPGGGRRGRRRDRLDPALLVRAVGRAGGGGLPPGQAQDPSRVGTSNRSAPCGPAFGVAGPPGRCQWQLPPSDAAAHLAVAGPLRSPLHRAAARRRRPGRPSPSWPEPCAPRCAWTSRSPRRRAARTAIALGACRSGQHQAGAGGRPTSRPSGSTICASPAGCRCGAAACSRPAIGRAANLALASLRRLLPAGRPLGLGAVLPGGHHRPAVILDPDGTIEVPDGPGRGPTSAPSGSTK